MSARYHPRDKVHYIQAICGVCYRPTLFVIRTKPNAGVDASAILGPGFNGDPFVHADAGALKAQGVTGLLIEQTYPPPPPTSAPPNVPPKVEAAFVDGLKAFDAGLYPAAAFSVRQALERAIRSFVPDGTDGLKARIKRLDGKHQVPPSLVELAHAVRAEGNVAVHEEDWTRDDAAKLIEFARLLFVYIFTLPAEVMAVATNRGAAAAER